MSARATAAATTVNTPASTNSPLGMPASGIATPTFGSVLIPPSVQDIPDNMESCLSHIIPPRSSKKRKIEQEIADGATTLSTLRSRRARLLQCKRILKKIKDGFHDETVDEAIEEAMLKLAAKARVFDTIFTPLEARQ